MKYYDVEIVSVIHIGVQANSENDAQKIAEDLVWKSDCQDEFTDNAETQTVNEIDEEEYDCLTLKDEEL